MSKDNLALRKQQLDAVQMSEQMAFTFKAVKAAPKNYISEADMVLADVAILEALMLLDLSCGYCQIPYLLHHLIESLFHCVHIC